MAVDEVFDGAVRHIFCEWEAFPTAVLKKHWPDGEYWGDIADLVAHTAKPGLEGQAGKGLQGRSDGLTLLTGGFPCQPFSQAGQRRGTADNRYKWPEMFEVIRNVSPDWVIAENVAGLVSWSEGMVLEQVCTDLEGEGYEVWPLVIPAVAVNAPHRRDRIWIIANRQQSGLEGRKPDQAKRYDRQSDRNGPNETSNFNAQNTLSQRGRGRNEDSGQILERQSTQVQDQRPSWESDWLEVATELCSLDDGLPARMGDTTITKAKHRTEQLKAYGNAIVPQVAVEIMKAIKLTEQCNA